MLPEEDNNQKGKKKTISLTMYPLLQLLNERFKFSQHTLNKVLIILSEEIFKSLIIFYKNSFFGY